MLVRYSDDGERHCWPLSKASPVTIGRDKSCAVSLPLRQISRHHALVRWQQDRYVIEDLGSTNGTFVNDVACNRPTALRNNDEIQIGLAAKLIFLDEETTEPIKLEHSQPGLVIDYERHILIIDGIRLDEPLSPPQFRLMALLLEAKGRIVSRNGIVDALWPDESFHGISEQAIDAMVRRLRLRIKEVDTNHQYVETVRGYGFRFVQKHSRLTVP